MQKFKDEKKDRDYVFCNKCNKRIYEVYCNICNEKKPCCIKCARKCKLFDKKVKGKK